MYFVHYCAHLRKFLIMQGRNTMKRYGALRIACWLFAFALVLQSVTCLVIIDVQANMSDDFAEKYGRGKRVPPCVIIDVIESTIPKQWNIGT